MATKDSERSRLVELLWKIKQAVNKTSGHYVHFNMLLNDPNYRDEIITKAGESEDSELRRLAEEAKELNVDGKLVSAPHAANFESAPDGAKTAVEGSSDLGEKGDGEAGPETVQMPHTPPPSRPTRGEVHGRSPGLGIAITAFIVILLGGVLGYLATSENVPGLAGGEIRISGSIVEPTYWTKDQQYLLEGVVFVEAGATLSIEPGTVIRGSAGSSLVVTRDSKIFARGTADEPIVFTSAQSEGLRNRGDWGGVVLLGNAPINRGSAHIEGIPEEDPRGRFGGNNTKHNCGVLEYVRIEFAGYEIGANNELNGLTLGGCSDASIIRYIQVHRGLDDGIEVFGGNVDLSHVVITGAKDDSFDWDMGWRGRVQFMVVQQHPDVGDNAFEGDNWKSQPDAEPRSAPVFYNMTLVGSRNFEQDQRAMTLRRGTGGIFRNAIITGFPLETVDIRGVETARLVETGELDFSNLILFDIGPNGRDYFSKEDDDDGGFAEESYFFDSSRNIRRGENPRLPLEAFDPENPRFTPAGISPAVEGSAPVPTADATSASEHEFWDEAADYIGAVRPGVTKSWLQGWTAFPLN